MNTCPFCPCGLANHLINNDGFGTTNTFYCHTIVVEIPGRPNNSVRGVGCLMNEIRDLRFELLRCYNLIPGVSKEVVLPAYFTPGSVSDSLHAYLSQHASNAMSSQDKSTIGEQHNGDLNPNWKDTLSQRPSPHA